MPRCRSTPPLTIPSCAPQPRWRWCLALLAGATVGCGSTRWSDSKRTATEQLLVSDAIERAVMRIDMTPLRGRSVYLVATALNGVDDGAYLAAAVRHQILASGCALSEKRDQAEVVVEARAGAIGTDRNELLFGLPATSVSVAGNGTSLPEMAIAKRTNQRAVAKLNIVAYDRESGVALWQSGLANVDSRTRDRWLLGTGPFQDGDINDEMEFAGERLHHRKATDGSVAVDLREPRVFAGPQSGRSVDATADARPQDLPPVR